MHSQNELLKLFGTSEFPAPGKIIRVGHLSFEFNAESIRNIRWRNVEVIRGITWPMRDSNWIALAQDSAEESVEIRDDEARISLGFTVDNAALNCSLAICASATGSIVAELAMAATEEFKTNRSGFSVLHPIKDVAGMPVTIRHSDGRHESKEFPALISPSQPAFDIAGIGHKVDGIDVEISFEGEIFEMEDQRNWSDASYKTYCRPLVFPFTYSIAKGEVATQKISVKLSGDPTTFTRESTQHELSFSSLPVRFPDVGFAVEAGWLPEDEQLGLFRNAGAKFAQVRTGPQHDTGFLENGSRFATAIEAEIDAEIVTADADQEKAISEAVGAMQEAGFVPERVIALPEAYLDSHQPTGPWPEGPSPRESHIAARLAFPDARVGGGVLTNFTEFNRCPPDASICDFVSHGITAIVHAADDKTVIESLESHPCIHESVAALAPNRSIRLGLTAIGMRSNPYGPEVADNPHLGRQVMAMSDPRQVGLFAAAWAVGALANTEGYPVDALSIASPIGPFGIVAGSKAQSETASGAKRIYPLYHVFRSAAEMSGQSRYSIKNLPPGIHGFAAGSNGVTRLVLANLGQKECELPMSGYTYSIRILDTSTYNDAAADPDWIKCAPCREGESICLKPLSILFAAI